MKKLLLALLAATWVAAGVTPMDAEAAEKKKPVRVAKHVKPAKHHARHSSRPYSRRASLDDPQHLALRSLAVLVQDQVTGAVLYEKNPNVVLPIASITKLMTAMVALDAQPNLEETLTIGEEDVDTLKGTRSRLKVGTQLSREDMLRLALMSSENRAAAVLSRHYPGGRSAFVAAMNVKAKVLGLNDTHFEDPTGLTAANVSSPRDLAKMVDAAHQYPLIREFTTTAEEEVTIAGRPQQFRNTNTLVRNSNSSWDIGLSKTGYINEAGKCLVMQVWINSKPVIIVLLDSLGRMTRIGDANRIKRWVETASLPHSPAG